MILDNHGRGVPPILPSIVLSPSRRSPTIAFSGTWCHE